MPRFREKYPLPSPLPSSSSLLPPYTPILLFSYNLYPNYVSLFLLLLLFFYFSFIYYYIYRAEIDRASTPVFTHFDAHVHCSGCVLLFRCRCFVHLPQLFQASFVQMSHFLTAKTVHMSKFGRFSPGCVPFFHRPEPTIGNFRPSSGIICSQSPQIIPVRV